MKNLKTIGFAILVSIIFEYFFNTLVKDLDLQKSIQSFFFHYFVLIITIFIAINFRNSSLSRIQNFKKGLFISIIFSALISGYYYSYYSWMNPNLLINKRNSLLKLTETDHILFEARNKIKDNPNYYNGKSAEDLIEMQQDNINDLLQPSKVFPLSLFSFLLVGMIFTIITVFIKFIFKNPY